MEEFLKKRECIDLSPTAIEKFINGFLGNAQKKTLFFTGKESVMIARGSYKERILKICLNAELNGLLLLDEFQFIQGISTMLKLLTDKFGNLRILCSGSSSLYILQNIEESLMGRVRVIEVLSLSLGLSFVD